MVSNAGKQQARERERRRRLQAERRRFETDIETAQAAAEHAAAAGIDPPPDPSPPLDPRPVPPAATPEKVLGSASPEGSGKRLPGQQLTCGWCGGPVLVKHTGRLPKWCSETCRHRAWEQSRAAASGQSAVRVLDRYIHAVPNTTDGWVEQLTKLAGQIEHQPNLDLDLLGACLDALREAITNHTGWRDTERRY